MKKLLLMLPLALILCFMVGCQNKEVLAELEEYKAQAALEEQNKELVLRYNEEIDNQNFDAVMELLSPDYAYYFPSGGREPGSREQAIA